jgi:hypothetical protein
MLGKPRNFEIDGERGYFRPTGAMSLDQAVGLVNDALAFARRKELREMLVDVTGLTGFPAPTMYERFTLATQWAETAGSRIRLSVVARKELIHEQKFGITVARNRGLDSNIFTTQKEAIAWLESKSAGGA